jgi:hypothetical protein
MDTSELLVNKKDLIDGLGKGLRVIVCQGAVA